MTLGYQSSGYLTGRTAVEPLYASLPVTGAGETILARLRQSA